MLTKLLLVDDEEFMRLMTVQSLIDMGYAVDTASDGLEAWEKLQGNIAGYDLVLMDKNMPRMDGIALLKCLKADQRLKDLPVVMLTSAGQPEDISEGLANGAYYYLTKPAPQQILQSIINNALTEARNRWELQGLLSQHKTNLSILCRAEFSFQTLKQAKDLALLLADASMDPLRTVSGYSELLINAVEHGNLGISYQEKSQLLKEGRWTEEVERRLSCSAYANLKVNVILDKSPSACVVTITDQGQGFDWQKYTGFDANRAFDLHGRGIAMSKVLSFDNLEYQGKGNCVVVTVKTPGYR